MSRLDDGYQTLITFTEDSSVLFYEKTVTPPGMDGGDEVDTTTMLNTTYRTRNPKALITMTNCSMTVAYDPACYPEIVELLNVNGEIKVTFPDSSYLTFWGWLDKFIPGEHQEGEQPTAEIEIVPSNQDAAGAEIAPVHTP